MQRVLEGSVDLDVQINGRAERLTLLRERALWWERTGTLFAADVHIGKAAAFRAWGAPVPEQVTHADLARLAALARHLAPQRLIVLGDLLHAPAGMTDTTFTALRQWRTAVDGLPIVLIRGNHDRKIDAGWADTLNITQVEEGQPLEHAPGVQLLHDPSAWTGRGLALAGHLHPGVVLRPAGGGKAAGLRAPCFWLQKAQAGELLVLPAFGAFTGLMPVGAAPTDRVFAVGPECVIEVMGA